MHKAALVGSQKQLTRCFRELDVASPKSKEVAKLEEWFIHMLDTSTMATAPMRQRI